MAVTTKELEILRRRIAGPKKPPRISALAGLPRGSMVIRAGCRPSSWLRTLDRIEWSECCGDWLAFLDSSTPKACCCLASELRLSGDQLELFA